MEHYNQSYNAGFSSNHNNVLKWNLDLFSKNISEHSSFSFYLLNICLYSNTDVVKKKVPMTVRKKLKM